MMQSVKCNNKAFIGHLVFIFLQQGENAFCFGEKSLQNFSGFKVSDE